MHAYKIWYMYAMFFPQYAIHLITTITIVAYILATPVFLKVACTTFY